MKIKLLFVLGVILTFISTGSVTAQVRKPAVAGAFYPAHPKGLREEVRRFLDEARVDEKSLPKGELIGIVVPHAGYSYSGGVAGYAFRLLQGAQYDTVVIMGPNHRIWGFNNVSIYNKGSYKTPLGEIPIDSELAEAIVKTGEVGFYPKVHRWEHSIEVELPFLQVVLGDFKLVPIVMGDFSRTTCERLANAILDNAENRKILVVASSDLSHDRPYSKAVEMDKLGLDYVANLDIDNLIKAEATGKVEMCGYGPVLTLMFLAQRMGGVKGVLLRYANSGDVTGDKSGRIVGYGAVAFYKPRTFLQDNTSAQKENFILEKSNLKAKGYSEEVRDKKGEENMNQNKNKDNEYTLEEKKALLKIARTSIRDYLSTGKAGDYSVFSPKFEELRGVFVTLHKHGQLRGCIGYIEPIKSLHRAVIDNAINAAVNDYRFPRVETEELPDIDIELSVLTPPEEIKGSEEFIVGKHGIIIKKGFRNAVFLPQVAPEQGWDREETLTQLCLKAGLAPDEWKKEGMRFFVFTAEVFGEKELE